MRQSLVGFLVAFSAHLVAGCGAPTINPGRIEPTYNDSTGRLELLRYDANADGKVDTWSYMDGAVIVRIEIDTNHDGLLDRWEYYEPDGRIEKVGSSRRQDGSPDLWAYYAHDGSIARLELASPDRAKVDRIEHYDKGVIVRAEEDTTGDGKPDKWEVYDGARLASVAFDTTQSGSPDRRLVYRADGSVQFEAVEPASQQPPNPRTSSLQSVPNSSETSIGQGITPERSRRHVEATTSP